MSIPEPLKQLIESKLQEYCDSKIPKNVRDKIRLNYRIRGNTISLVELRPILNNPEKWSDMVIAQFRYDPQSALWTLYCADRNSKWHLYINTEPTKYFNQLLEEVDEDPTGICWG